METIKTLYQNERRALKLSLYNDNDSFDDITESFYSVYDNDGNIVIAEQKAYTDDNSASVVIGTTVTSTIGTYYIIWKIIDNNNYIYYHKTLLQVT